MTSKATSLTTTGPATAGRIATTERTGAAISTDASASAGAAFPALTGDQSKDQSETQSEVPWSRELIKQIAMDIGKETVAYIEVMYPEAIKATSSTFKLSLRNHIHNEIMAAIDVTDTGHIASRLDDRKRFRRWWLASYRKIRRGTKLSPDANEH